MWNKATDPEESFRDKAIWWSAGIVIAAAIAIGVYYRYYSPVPAAPPAQHPAAAPQPAAPPPAPAIQHPIPPAAEQQQAPLPPLDQSDPVVRDSLIGLLGKPAVAKFLVPHQIIRDVVVTVDNLPRKKVAAELRPLQPTPGDTAVDTQGSCDDSQSAELRTLRGTDGRRAARPTRRRWPPSTSGSIRSSNRRMRISVTPGSTSTTAWCRPSTACSPPRMYQGPIELVRPKVFYQFADPKLEALPAGQKLLIRMGPQNASVIKAKLQQFRAAITAQPPQMNQPQRRPPAARTCAAAAGQLGDAGESAAARDAGNARQPASLAARSRHPPLRASPAHRCDVAALRSRSPLRLSSFGRARVAAARSLTPPTAARGAACSWRCRGAAAARTIRAG